LALHSRRIETGFVNKNQVLTRDRNQDDLEAGPKTKELAMKKLLVAGVLGAMLMVTAGTQVASAAGGRSGFRGHAYAHPGYRTAFARPHYYGRYAGPAYGYNRCW
jgi:hypothetical protein